MFVAFLIGMPFISALRVRAQSSLEPFGLDTQMPALMLGAYAYLTVSRNFLHLAGV
jgi:hypothetical protein